jgi:amino acid permease
MMIGVSSIARNPTISRMRSVVHVAVAISGVAYLIVGILGYLTFLEETEGNIFNNYDDDLYVGAPP